MSTVHHGAGHGPVTDRLCFVVFAGPGHKAPSHPCAVPRCAAGSFHSTSSYESKSIEKRNCSPQHRSSCLSMASYLLQHARTHACSSMASAAFFFLGTMASAASFVRFGALRVLRREDRGQETSNGHQQLAFHARTARRGLCQDLRGAWSSQRTLPWPLLSLPRQLQETCYRSTAASDHFVFD